jgi:RNase P/RNase MRP subunit p30
MFVDIVFPSKNEAEFVKTAEKLGYSGICFAYNYQKDVNLIRQQIARLQKDTKLNLYLGLVAKPADVRKAGNICELVLVEGSEKNHDILERLPVDILFGSEFVMKRDAMHYRSSGLNQILCRLAVKNKVIIGFNLRMIDEAVNLPMAIGRMMQNIVLCRKYKAKTAVFTGAGKAQQMKGVSDLMSLMVVFGLNEGEAKESLKAVSEKIKENIKKKEPTYIKEGVELVE